MSHSTRVCLGVNMNPVFLERIKNYIPNEYDQFLDTLSNPMYQGLRVNIKKINQELFERKFKYLDGKTPFCREGYYIHTNLGNHPYHICGLYYVQEPSASSAVEALDVQEGDIVLDLCAAPGGKSTQIAAHLQSGYLISNEIEAKRAQILLSNMERMGIMNFAITNSNSYKLSKQFPSCFTKVLVDAPCSGEGMMKKHSKANEEWSLENVLYCAKRQKEILEDAYTMLQKDGILVYSTCTYAIEENEEVVHAFLKAHPDMELMEIQPQFGRQGFPYKDLYFSKVRRIFPMDKGEGHFVCKMRKTQGEKRKLPILKNSKLDKVSHTFMHEQLKIEPTNYSVQQDHVYCMNRDFVDFKKVKCIRQGLYCGQLIKNRFEPAHAFYLNADWISNYQKKVEVSFDEMNAFMHGLEIEKEGDKGYVALCFEGIPFGFGKCDGKKIKNKIPKGLRLLQGSKLIEV